MNTGTYLVLNTETALFTTFLGFCNMIQLQKVMVQDLAQSSFGFVDIQCSVTLCDLCHSRAGTNTATGDTHTHISDIT